MKSMAAVCGGMALGLVLAGAQDLPESPISLSSEVLNTWVEEARARHPGLRAAQARQRAAEHAIDGIRLWEDPMFRVGGVVASPAGPSLEMEGDLSYMVQQSLPLFGKATAQRREAEAGAELAGAAAAYQFQLLRRSVVQAVQQLAFADELLRIGTNDLHLLERMTEFARERQRAGLDSALDLLRLENERQAAEQQLITDRLQRDFERVTVNRLLGRPQETPWPVLELSEPPPPIPLTERLFSLGARHEPRLRMLQREVALAEAGQEVTRRRRRPDLNLGIEGRQWSGSGDFREGMFSVGLNLPWFNRGHYRADLDRDRARADAVRADAEDYELDVRRELFRVWTRIDAARRETLLYRDGILPRSRLAVDTALAAWAAGRGQFLDVLEARRSLTAARRTQARAALDQQQMITELVTCCGVADLDALLMLDIVVPQPAPRP